MIPSYSLRAALIPAEILKPGLVLAGLIGLAIGLCATAVIAQNVNPYGAKRVEDQGLQDSASAGGATFTIQIDKSVFDLADVIQLDYRVTAPEGSHLIPLAFDDAVGPFALLHHTPLVELEKNGKREWGASLILDAPHAGTFVLPRLTAHIQSAGAAPIQLITKPLTLSITTFLPPNPDIRGLKESYAPLELAPQPVAWERWLLLAAGAAAVLAGALLFWLWRAGIFRRRQQQIPLESDILAALGKLEQDAMSAETTADRYYSRLTDILRRYVTRRWHFPAASRTTPEMLSTLPARTIANDNSLPELLQTCDGAKFGRQGSAPSARIQAVGAARAFVEATAPGRDAV